MSYNSGRDDYGGDSARGQRDDYYNQGQQDDYNSGRHQEYGGDSGGYSGGSNEYNDGRQDYNNPGRENYGNERYNASSGYGTQGSSHYNSGGGYGTGGNYGPSSGPQQDFSGAMHHAQQHSGSSGDSTLFNSALSYLSSNHSSISSSSLDEEHAVSSHQAMYNPSHSSSSQHNSETIGTGAAMQALKLFTGGNSGMGAGGGAGMGHGSQGGGSSQNEFVGMAMAQASRLFDEKKGEGRVEEGSGKENAVTKAGEMALKMYLKSQMGGSGGGGGAGVAGMLGRLI